MMGTTLTVDSPLINVISIGNRGRHERHGNLQCVLVSFDHQMDGRVRVLRFDLIDQFSY